jgi:hypothetical protein
MTKLVEKDATHIVEEDDIVPPPMYDETAGPQVITADTARQAPLGKPVFWVLIGAMALVCVGFVVVWMFSGSPPAH